MLALAHRFEELVRSREVKDYADLARLGRVSRARVSQILKLLTLAPPIQELILNLPPRAPGEKTITERHLRDVLSEPRWDRQRVVFKRSMPLRGLPASAKLACAEPQVQRIQAYSPPMSW